MRYRFLDEHTFWREIDILVTIRDVAKRAGVSVPTVSRVLNKHPGVGEELVARTLAAIADLNYHPSRAAQQLRTQDSGRVAVVFSDLSNQFHISVLKGIEQVLSVEGISITIGNADQDPKREAALIDIVLSDNAKGLIIAPTREDVPAVERAVEQGLPVVVVDRRMRNVAVDTIYTDSAKGAQDAVRHLIELGNQRVAMISGPIHLTSAQDRYSGYMQAISDAAISFDPSLLRFGDYRQESGYRLARELMGLEQPPSAIFVANNAMTIGALNAIHEMGRAIPEEIAIVGFDEVDWAISLNPPLTTVAQSPVEIGVGAATMLLERIAGKATSARTIVRDTSLQIRASCGAELRPK
ncbi:MAG TPA: LacI family DNA-binding transcriptional regulator [Devosia sp.]|uniref:LacI family DNA-binding transcriptional regulator n=1 Tax=Devosia sp. TaxID=1871048 RepID=UPI002DDC91BE|nr:LacI family DNA-binding transcriptional regulator [Devosia sp.]HEV2514242.1 LacI family DNA-binding transcriptional regulator [Devosia sp.]